MAEPRFRKKLNEEQVQVLELLYKFRFGTNDLVAKYFGKKHRSFVFKRLKILLEQGLIGKRFDSSYRIQGKPAAYYLLPAGAKRLPEYRASDDTDEINIRGIYKDKNVSEQFVVRCLDIFATYNQLKAIYGEKLLFLTKTDLAPYDYFPKQLPDAYLRLKTEEGEKEFFLLLHYSHQQFFAVTRRLQQYIKYAESGGWDEAGTELPILIVAFESRSDQRRFHKKAARLANGLKTCGTTLEELKDVADPKGEILHPLDALEESVALPDA